ncbi:MAG: malate synthase A [Nitrososphaerales archaeon]
MLVLAEGIEITTQIDPSYSEILSPEALQFVSSIERKFGQRRIELLAERSRKQSRYDSGLEKPNFLRQSEEIKNPVWRVSPAPMDLQDRRVEITGPSGDTKMVINAFNSGASTYMSDFEDSQSPTWEASIQGQVNLRDAVRGTINFTSLEGKKYKLNEGKIATLIIRPRGLHLVEQHVLVDKKPISASFFDYGLYLFHNSKKLVEEGSGPYFYIPKLESHLEARMWNEVFTFSEELLGLTKGTIKATVLIETLPAAFEMEEILYELREHSTGLNCGRWDYMFSYIKKLKGYPDHVLPERSQLTMDKGFLAPYVDLLIKTCHKRGAHAIGGMSAYIPVKDNDEANKKAFEKVRLDKEREVRAGHDGTWVAHPGLVALAKQVFDSSMKRPNQIQNLREGVHVTQQDLLAVPDGEITEEGLRINVNVGLRYISAWLGGKGSVPIFNLMEDAATAEICRAQAWQWIHHGAKLSDGRKITLEHVRHVVKGELAKLEQEVGSDLFTHGHYTLAAELFDLLVSSEEFKDFLTTLAYPHLIKIEDARKS